MIPNIKTFVTLAVMVMVSVGTVSCDKISQIFSGVKEYPYSSSLIIKQTETRGEGHVFESSIDLKGNTQNISGGLMTTVPGESAVTSLSNIVLYATEDVNIVSSDPDVIQVKQTDSRHWSLVYKSDGEAFIRVFFAEPGDGIDIPYDSKVYIPVEAIRFWMGGYNCDIGDKAGWRFAPAKGKNDWLTGTEPYDTINSERAQLIYREKNKYSPEGEDWYDEMYDVTGRTLEKFTLWPLNASQVDGWNYIQNNESFFFVNFHKSYIEKYKQNLTCANWQWVEPTSKTYYTNSNGEPFYSSIKKIKRENYSFTEMEGLKGPATEIPRTYWEKYGGTWKYCPENFYFYVTDIDGKEKYFCVRHTSYDKDWNIATPTVALGGQ